MRKTLILLAVLAAAVAFWIYQMPTHVVEVTRNHTFTIPEDFVVVRKTLQRDDLMRAILEANGGTILKKQWINGRVEAKKNPDERRRTWILHGTMLAQVVVPDPDGNEMQVDLRQEIAISQNAIDAEVKLDHPLAVGLTNMKQRIQIRPIGPNQTSVSLDLSMKFRRKIPHAYKQFATDRVNEAADKQINQVEPALRELIVKHR